MRPCGDGGFRRSSPLRGSPPFSGANADSILHPRPGWSSECDAQPGVSIKTFFTHVEFNIRHAVSKSGHFTHNMTFFHHVVRRKRFNTHGELHCMEMTISKDHVAEKPGRG